MNCVECSRATMPHKRWLRATDDERTGLTPHRGRGLCVACYERAKRDGSLIDHERTMWKSGDLMDDALWLIDNRGLRYADLPAEMGVTRNALARAIRRAALRGDERAIRLANLNNYRTKGAAA